MAKYKTKSRIERDQSRVLDTPTPSIVTVGSVIDVITTNGKSVGNIIISVKNEDGTYSNEIAFPASPHFISLPLPNERVSCIKDSSSSKWYYLTPLCKPGLVNHMGNSGKRTFIQDTSELYTGKTFTPSPSLRSINIFEGDTIFQGRGGQSIRFGSKRQAVNAPWNADGDEGLPIITIRSGVSQIENLQTDFSSIYLTSGQSLPIVLENKIPNTYIKPNMFTDNQIVLTSDRLVLYTKTDSIILSSFKDVSISTDKVNVDFSTLIEQITLLCNEVLELSENVSTHARNSASSTHVSAAPGSPTTTSINAPQFQQVSIKTNTIKNKVQQIKNKLDNMKQ